MSIHMQLSYAQRDMASSTASRLQLCSCSQSVHPHASLTITCCALYARSANLPRIDPHLYLHTLRAQVNTRGVPRTVGVILRPVRPPVCSECDPSEHSGVFVPLISTLL